MLGTLLLMSLPVWYENSPTCRTYPGNDLTACFQNQTNGQLHEYAFMITNHYMNGHSDWSVTPLDGTRPGYFIGASISKGYLEAKKIASVEFSLVKGDARSQDKILGCNIEVSADSAAKTVLMIVNSGQVHC